MNKGTRRIMSSLIVLTIVLSFIILETQEVAFADGIPDDYASLEWKAMLGWAPWGLGIADLSNDGEMEILVGNQPGLLRVFDGTTHDELENISIGRWLSGIPVADLDNDGMQEVVTANDYFGDKFMGIVHIFEWTGTNLVLEWQSDNLGWKINDIEIADIDLDGVLEIVIATSDNNTHAISYNYNLMSYHVEKTGTSTSNEANELEVAEIDNDPVPEVLMTDINGLYVFDGETLNVEWSLLYSDDLRLFSSNGLAVGDLNKDGDMEVVIGARNSWIILDPISKNITAEIPRQSVGMDVAIMDIDLDGTIEFFGTVFQDLNLSGEGPGGYLVVYDGETFEQEWRSPNLWFEGYDLGAYRIRAGNVDHDAAIEVLVSTYGGVFQYEINSGQPTQIEAEIDIDPNTLNLKSNGKWITCYIELPQDYDVRDIDASTILLEDCISPILDPKYGFVKSEDGYIMDHDGDGILERMVKFDRSEVEDMLAPGTYNLKVTGELLDGTSFEGYSDEIRVIDPP